MFRKFVCPEIIFGDSSLPQAAAYVRNLSLQRVMVVTDPGVREARWMEALIGALKKQGTTFHIYDQVTPNPKMEEVMAGAAAFHENDCEGIIAIGGGSPMDCAKGIAIVSTNHHDIRHFEGVDQVKVPMPPLICVPTTAGSSADVSQFAIISDTERRVKMAIISKAVVPDVAILDPATLTTMDAYLAACTGIDALVHAIEAYVSNAHSRLTDPHALRAIERIAKHFLPSIEDPLDLEHKNEMMLASMEAGLAFSNASLGLVHAMAHSLGGYLLLAHGECNALLLEHVIAYNFESAEARYGAIAQIFDPSLAGASGNELRDGLLAALRHLRETAGIHETLSGRGVTVELTHRLAEFAYRDACVFTNPRKPTVEEIAGIYRAAL